jgi:hypothetical protein
MPPTDYAELRTIINQQQLLLERQAVLIAELRQELALATAENNLPERPERQQEINEARSRGRLQKVSQEERLRIAKLGAEKRWAGRGAKAE